MSNEILKSEIELKRDGMDVGMFTALSVQTPEPTRETVDEDIYRVNNEENLPQDAKSMTQLAFVKGEAGEAVPFDVWIADTDEARYEGLSSKNQLQANRGMLFDWGELDINGLMMRNMSFPIDMVFLDEGGYVQGVVKDVHPDDDRTKSMVCQYAVELPAGTVEEFGLDQPKVRAYAKSIHEPDPQIYNLDKDRVYIDDPAEIPAGATVHTGGRGGLYYETGEQSEFAQFQMDTDAERMQEFDFTDEQIQKATDELGRVHEKAGDIFSQWVEAADEVAEVTGASHRTKSVGSALEKVHDRKPEKYDEVADLKDMHGSMVKVETVNQAEELYEKLQDEFDIVEAKDKYEDGGPYRAHHLIADVNGETVELQIKQKDLSEVADASHQLTLKPEQEAPVEEMDTLDDVPGPELQDDLVDCLTQQADYVTGDGDDVDCAEQAAAVLEEFYALA